MVVVRDVSIRAKRVKLRGGLMAAPGQTSDSTIIRSKHCEITKGCPKNISLVVKVSSYSYQETFSIYLKNLVL